MKVSVDDTPGTERMRLTVSSSASSSSHDDLAQEVERAGGDHEVVDSVERRSASATVGRARRSARRSSPSAARSRATAGW